jgi:hypothetical protein
VACAKSHAKDNNLYRPQLILVSYSSQALFSLPLCYFVAPVMTAVSLLALITQLLSSFVFLIHQHPSILHSEPDHDIIQLEKIIVLTSGVDVNLHCCGSRVPIVVTSII